MKITEAMYEENIRNLELRLGDRLDEDTRLVLQNWLERDRKSLEQLKSKKGVTV